MSVPSAKPIVVFDLDGVLLDSAEANVQAFRYGLEQVGVTVSGRQAVLRLVGLPATEMLRRLGCPEESVRSVFNDHVRPFYVENLPALATAYPGAERILTNLKASGFHIAACTSGDRVTQTAALKAVRLWDHIEAMQTPDDSAHGKPDKRYLLELLAKFEGHGRVFHVEDSEVGLLMGQECGAVTIYASYGNGELSGAVKPDRTIATLVELPLAILSTQSEEA